MSDPKFPQEQKSGVPDETLGSAKCIVKEITPAESSKARQGNVLHKSQRRIDALVQAAFSSEGAIETVIQQTDERQSSTGIPEAETRVLQNIAHGGGGFGSSYGSGPTSGNTDLTIPLADPARSQRPASVETALASREALREEKRTSRVEERKDEA